MAEMNIITVDSNLVASKKRRQELIKACARNGVTLVSIDVTNPSLTTSDNVATILRKVEKIKTARKNIFSDAELKAIIIN